MKINKDLTISNTSKTWEEDFKRMYPLEYAIDGMMQSGIEPKDAHIMAEVHRNEIIMFIRSLLSFQLAIIEKEVKKLIEEDKIAQKDCETPHDLYHTGVNEALSDVKSILKKI